ncbi:MAG: phosphate uptake regulator PhoU [Euryarchaeota archaeon]|jgi:phosphate uptake regulator|nr:phosphate uptake regulator PhoU [Euryarchaeota archaeon]MBT4407236.1 phosphate uptake regulator PhoU [Euryarchaeota archaeon]MBT6644989.1 phosphate uptake regulator PhoU [Euryarchaeota archaeon]
MANNPGSRDVRKLQVTGGATFTLSLPKKWVEEKGLEASDGVLVDWRPSGALRITPAAGMERTTNQITLNIDDIPEGAMYDHLIGAYLSGADVIIVQDENGIDRTTKRTIRSMLRTVRGFEIAEEKENMVKMLTLMSASDMPLKASINRMYQQLTSLIRDEFEVLNGGNKEIIEDHEDRELEIDAMRLLIDRQVASLLDSYLVADALKMGRREAVEYANISRSLERMADHANHIAALIMNTIELPSMDSLIGPLSQLPIWQEALRTLMINLRAHDVHSIEGARSSLKEAQTQLAAFEESLWKEGKGKDENAIRILFLFRLSESIRRLCAYARDFGEVLLNMILHSNLIETKEGANEWLVIDN